MKTVRLLVLMQLLVTLASRSAIANEEGNWYFQVYLDDRPIGYHHFILHDNILQSTAEFDVKVLFFNAYQYRHRNTEQWNNGCLVSIRSETSDNGEQYSVNGTIVDNNFQVLTGNDKSSLPGCVRTYAYWNPGLLDVPNLLNTQTGEYQEVNLVKTGSSDFNHNGKTVQADRYVLKTVDRDIELWYGPEGDWLALNSTTKGGRILRYERQFSDRLTKTQKQPVNRGRL